jgi:redox-sensitive bicupin YhaK (pirin superfamily)
MGFRALRVINDDRIEAGTGFGPHGHRDMEIITYVLDGHLLHRDSMGERHVLGPNEVQTMSAGTGIVHSEFNASEEEPVHSIQIWILPDKEDVKPSYQQIAFGPEEKQGRLRLLAGPMAARQPSIRTRGSTSRKLRRNRAYRTSWHREDTPGCKWCGAMYR